MEMSGSVAPDLTARMVAMESNVEPFAALQAVVFGLTPVFVATAGKTIGNTAAEATAFATGVGSLTLPAGFWTVGRSITVEGDIQFSTAVVLPTLTVAIKSNGVTLVSTVVGNLLGLASNSPGHFKARLTCRATGASGLLAVSGVMDYATSATARGFADLIGTATIDTTIAQTLDVTAKWNTANASNTLTVINAVAMPS